MASYVEHGLYAYTESVQYAADYVSSDAKFGVLRFPNADGS
jgi:hypothetical protein